MEDGDAHLLRNRLRGGVIIAGQHDDFNVHAAQTRHGCLRTRPQRIGDSDITEQCVLFGHSDHGFALRLQFGELGFVNGDALFADEFGRAEPECLPGNLRFYTFACNSFKIGAGCRLYFHGERALEYGARERMF